ncbi:MAG: hypothetical protein ACYC7E_17685 [Armatimonadota bacterium]
MKSSLKRCLISLGLAVLALPALAGYTTNIDELVKKAEPWPELIAIPHARAVSKDTYAQIYSECYKTVQGYEYFLKHPKPYPNMAFHVDNAAWNARLFERTGNEGYAKIAVQFLEQAHKLLVAPPPEPNAQPNSNLVRWLYWIDKWLQPSAAYGAEPRKWTQAIVAKSCPNFPAGNAEEYGSANRPFRLALIGDCLLKLSPTAPDAARWRKYTDTVWNYWWEARDTDESTDHYNALWFRYLLEWIEVRGVEKEFWADRRVKQLMERYLYYVTPMGAFPHISDSCGWNVSWGHYAYLFEACATHYKDGRYKWAAHRIVDYSINRIEKLSSFGYTGAEAAWSLMKAYTIADDTIQEKPREFEVALIERRKWTLRPWEEIKRTALWFDLQPGVMPDKLVFYGGSDVDSMALMVDVVGDAGHSHAMRPTVLALTDHQSVLISSNGYRDIRPVDHNIPILQDFEGYPYDMTPTHFKNTNSQVQDVRALDLGVAGYGFARIGNYQGYPATLLREIVFVKNVAVLIKDSMTSTVGLNFRWGPLYRIRNVGPDYGPNWVNTYQGEWIPLRQIYKNSPVLARFRNSPRDLLVYFAPEKGGKLEIIDESDMDKTALLPLRVQYALRQAVQPNAPVSATTLLIPHAPGSAKALADKVKVTLNEPLKSAIEFTDPDGVRHLIVLNHSGQPLSLTGLQTDAEVAYARLREGKIDAVGLSGGKRFILGGKDVAGMAAAPKANVITVDH